MACSVQHSCNNLMTFNFHVKSVLGTSKIKSRNSIIYNHYRTTCELILVYLLVPELSSGDNGVQSSGLRRLHVPFCSEKGSFISVTFYI